MKCSIVVMLPGSCPYPLYPCTFMQALCESREKYPEQKPFWWVQCVVPANALCIQVALQICQEHYQ